MVGRPPSLHSHGWGSNVYYGPTHPTHEWAKGKERGEYLWACPAPMRIRRRQGHPYFPSSLAPLPSLNWGERNEKWFSRIFCPFYRKEMTVVSISSFSLTSRTNHWLVEWKNHVLFANAALMSFFVDSASLDTTAAEKRENGHLSCIDIFFVDPLWREKKGHLSETGAFKG